MSRTWNWVAQQWEKSNIISGLLALVIWSTIVYLAIIGRDPPDVLIAAGSIIVGYFFKAKTDA